MPDTQSCPKCWRVWEYTPTKSYCPRCGVKVVINRDSNQVQQVAYQQSADVQRVFSDLRDRLRKGR